MHCSDFSKFKYIVVLTHINCNSVKFLRRKRKNLFLPVYHSG